MTTPVSHWGIWKIPKKQSSFINCFISFMKSQHGAQSVGLSVLPYVLQVFWSIWRRREERATTGKTKITTNIRGKPSNLLGQDSLDQYFCRDCFNGCQMQLPSVLSLPNLRESVATSPEPSLGNWIDVSVSGCFFSNTHWHFLQTKSRVTLRRGFVERDNFGLGRGGVWTSRFCVLWRKMLSLIWNKFLIILITEALPPNDCRSWRVANYSKEFWTLAADARWNEETWQGMFVTGLNELSKMN